MVRNCKVLYVFTYLTVLYLITGRGAGRPPKESVRYSKVGTDYLTEYLTLVPYFIGILNDDEY